jgi:hypothetical protein
MWSQRAARANGCKFPALSAKIEGGHTMQRLMLIALLSLLSLGVAGADIGAVQRAAGKADETDSRLITVSEMGRLRLGMTLDQARAVLPAASFARTSDGDGAALVQIALGRDDSLIVWAEENDPAASIDWSKKIITIETFSGTFQTREGVHPGSLVNDVIKFFGPVREIVESEIEARQYVTFERQHRALTFRLDDTGIFSPGSRRTTHFAPTAKILSIAISSLP